MSDKTKIEVINRLRGIAIGVATTATSLSISPVNAQENTVKNNNINNNITLTEDVHSSVNDSATVDFMEALDSVDTNAYNSNLDNTKIGNLNYITCFFNTITENDETSPKEVQRPTIERISRDSEQYRAGAVAYYNHYKNAIYMQNTGENLSEALSEFFRKDNMAMTPAYRDNHPAALNAIALHELTHWRNDNFSDMKKLKYPSDIYRYNLVDEKMATTVEYLYIANQYSILKQQGVETIEYKGKQVSTEGLLEFYPGLKDYITKNGFSADNAKDIKNITNLACDYWEREGSGYRDQSYNATLAYSGVSNLFEVTGNDKKTYDQVINNMLKNVHIGNNTYVTLPRENIDNFSHEQTMIELGNRAVFDDLCPITYNEVKKLNQHYENMGISDNTKKQEQMKADFENIVYRRTDQNNLLSLLANEDGKTSITFADGSSEEKSTTAEDHSKEVYAKVGDLRMGLHSNSNSVQETNTHNSTDINLQKFVGVER